ncbi:MAG TPA: hypothetical protein VG273_06520 [Bryobacteraceae bacterium]|jgi:hypothetical protein|nr:hypothetical protein [Bryobacteraceae bacterium]
MHIFAGIAGIALIGFILLHGFSTIILARRSELFFKATATFYHGTWAPFAALGKRIRSGRDRESYLSVYGPASLIALIGGWGAGLVVAFGLLQWAAGLRLTPSTASLADSIFLSGVTLFEVGGPPPENGWSKLLVVLESGLGIGFLGLLVGYLPVLYQSYSRRELLTSILDVRAGSPSSASSFFKRQGMSVPDVRQQFSKCETWAADILQDHLSYPMLAYFRSQHINQSWLGTLVTILDASALAIVCGVPELSVQAKATFAVSRHSVADLARLFAAAPHGAPDRLPPPALEKLTNELSRGACLLDMGKFDASELNRYRSMYEPYAQALSVYFLMSLPEWRQDDSRPDNWVASTWDSRDDSAVSDPFSSGNSK